MECDLCGHRCMTQEGLDLHRLSHTGQTPLKCPVRPCRRRFTSNTTLEEHVLAHFQGTLSKSKNRPRFRCEICLKEFSYQSTFSVHMRTHTDERPFEVRSVVAPVYSYVKSHFLFDFVLSVHHSVTISHLPYHGHFCSLCPRGDSYLPVYL